MLVNEPIFQNLEQPVQGKKNLDRISFQERFQVLAIFADLLVLNCLLLTFLYVSQQEITTNTHAGIQLIQFIGVANFIWLLIAISKDIYVWHEVVRPTKKVTNLLYVVSIYFATLTTIYYLSLIHISEPTRPY